MVSDIDRKLTVVAVALVPMLVVLPSGNNGRRHVAGTD